MPTACVRCQAPDGAHYPWCTMASLFERLLGGPAQVPVEPHSSDWSQRQDSEPADPGLLADLRERVEELDTDLQQHRRLLAEAEAALAEMRERFAARSKAPDGDDVMRLRTKLTAAEENVKKALDARTLALQQRDRAREDRDTKGRELENARREKAEVERQLARAVEERNRIAEERNKAQSALAARGPVPPGQQMRAQVAAEQTRRTREAAEPNVVAEAVKAVEAEGAKVEVVPPRPAPKPAAPPAPKPAAAAAPKPEPAKAELPPVVRPAPPDKYPEGSDKAQRSREAADLFAAAELFVSERVEKAPGQRLKSPDLLRAFDAWLPTIGFTGKFTTPVIQARQVGLAMGRAGYGKRQFKEADGTQPTNYLGARLKGAREAESKEGNHPGPNGVAAAPADPVASVADMRAAAREARHYDGAGRVSLKPVKPGKELKSEPIRKMAIRLVEDAGWTYERPAARLNSHPRLIAPDGDKITLPSTPSVQGQVVITRAKLRRKLRALGHPNPAAVLP